MNVLIVMEVAAFAVCLLWAVQSVSLKLAGEPLSWPLRFTTRKPSVRWTSRVMIHVTWFIILVGTPLALGIPPREALRQAFPIPVPWRDMGVAFLLLLVPGWAACGLYLKAGWVRFEPKGDPATRRSKLVRRFLGPIPLATLEEAVFRGVLLEQLLRALPAAPACTALAIVLSSGVFAATHFLRPFTGKSAWQTAYGYFIVGNLFGLAYVVGGRSLWLPIALHAAAMFFTEVMRLYFVHQAAPWLIGSTESPQSGLVGSLIILGVGVGLVTLV